MFSQKLAAPIPPTSSTGMSYWFGPHMEIVHGGIYFRGDTRIVRVPSNKIKRFDGTVPMWLVADWMIAKKRGEPISRFAEEVLAQENGGALEWLQQVLDQ